MPAVSQAQRGYLYAHFGPQWVQAHHFDNPGPLPERVNPKAPYRTPAASALEALAGVKTRRKRRG